MSVGRAIIRLYDVSHNIYVNPNIKEYSHFYRIYFYEFIT